MNNESNGRAPVERTVRRICRSPKKGDRLEDSSGEIWVIVTQMTLSICEMEIADGEEFIYDI